MNKTLVSMSLMLAMGASSASADCTDSFDVTVDKADLTVTDDQSYIGTSGSAHIFADGNLDKPVIIVGGLDIFNSIGCTEFKEDLDSKSDLISRLNSQGKDVILVNFHDSLAGIESNALVLSKIITEVNTRKVWGHSNAVIGLSMGGLVSRYTLAHMEHYNLDHETRLFVSYDAPQKYASLPSGLMGLLPLVSVQDGMDMISDIFGSRSVKQMLVTRPFWLQDEDHVYDSNGNGVAETHIDTTDHNGELMAKFKKLGGYPNNLRKVAFSNGSAYGGVGAYPFGPGDPLMTLTGDLGIIDSLVIDQQTLNSFNESMKCIEEEAERAASYEEIGYIPEHGETRSSLACAISPYYLPALGSSPTLEALSFDNAPGSYSNLLNNIMDNLPADADITIDVHENEISFIPTISALDIQTDSLTYDVAGNINTLNQTPFDAIYYPLDNINEQHLEITPEKYWQLLDELDEHHNHIIQPKDITNITKSYRNSYRSGWRWKSYYCHYYGVKWDPQPGTAYYELYYSDRFTASSRRWSKLLTLQSTHAESITINSSKNGYLGVKACNKDGQCSPLTKATKEIGITDSRCSGTRY